jgi:hypothetical protein
VTEDDFNAIAWRDFILFAFNDSDCRKAFTEATGIQLGVDRSPIEALVDSATGSDGGAGAFVEWVTREHWSIEHAPKAYREEIKARSRR